MVEIKAYNLTAVKQPMELAKRSEEPADDEVIVEVKGCGVCHTDIGFAFEGVKTVHPLPLTLGHEIAGVVVGAGSGFDNLLQEQVIVPAILPCGECDVCKRGGGNHCPNQVFPGCHRHGGFASHVIVPGKGLCVVDKRRCAEDRLPDLAVVADAVTTPYQAIVKSGLRAGEIAVFIGVGGVGGFGVQIAKALGARTVAIDVSDERLQTMREYGADKTINARELDGKLIRKEVQGFAKEIGAPPVEWKIFETSGTAAGQTTAFGLLNHGATLMVVGYTLDVVTVRLSNLMAFDARAMGTWGCVPELYKPAVELVLEGKVRLEPFVERHPMSSINDIFSRIHERKISKRPVMIPDFD
ncbi:MAG: 6-hydroxycyclohex-1-ene-1-carbonyl-CoA dehydrogenase [Planctomycetes bacterium]|nr:6-hydroxycyclohex-1-ene-1-carbonyl-CoA dehydrogenase [Planctomycetota bacterium]